MARRHLFNGLSSIDEIVLSGFMLIAGRCRREDETLLIKDTLERNFKKKIDLENLFGGSALSSKKLSEKVC